MQSIFPDQLDEDTLSFPTRETSQEAVCRHAWLSSLGTDLEAATPAPCLHWLLGGATADAPDLPHHWSSGRDDGRGEPKPPAALEPSLLPREVPSLGASWPL